MYDDLGSKDQPRPALGGSTVLPYPRHLANNLPEGTTKGPGTPWLPAGEAPAGLHTLLHSYPALESDRLHRSQGARTVVLSCPGLAD